MLHSGEDGSDDFASNDGKATLKAIMVVGEALMVEAEQVQHCGVEVVDMNLVDGGLVPDLVGLPVGDTSLHAAASQPCSEAMRVVVPAGFGGFLGDRQTPELPPQMTRVSSSRPRWSRSVSRPAMG